MKSYPLILFLHGAGERGEDGVTPAQVVIGPAILKRGGVPALVLMPQARRTWAADSPDIEAALDALREVQARYKVDAKRVLLTGLSMGGWGSWELAAPHPELFAACALICGPGSIAKVDALRQVPIWAFWGDDDRVQTLHNLRSMVEALQGKGGHAHLTEYRGMEHKSWDRAYDDSGLLDRLLAAQRP